MKLNKRPGKPSPVNADDVKVTALEDAVILNRQAKRINTMLEDVKGVLKKEVFPFGEKVTEQTWSYSFGPHHPTCANASVQYTERTKPFLDIKAATSILKEKRLYSKCLTAPEPPAAPPPAFIDLDKVMQFRSEGKLTDSDIKKMIKTSKKDMVKSITIKEPDLEKSGNRKKAKSQ